MEIHSQNVRENLLLALDTLRTHKFRSLLTILGVLIGTTTVIAVASIIAGLNKQLVDVAEEFGTRSMFIFKFEGGLHFGRLSREERLRRPLSYEDAMVIREQCPALETVGVQGILWALPPAIKYKGKEMADDNFTGATPEVFRAVNADLSDGRLFTDVDNIHRRNVVVIGSDVVERLFQHEDPVGKLVQIGANSFEVIGTLGPRKEFLGDTGNNRRVFIPYWTFKKIYPAAKENFVVAVAQQGQLQEAMDEVTGVLRRRRNLKPSEPNNFAISTADTIIGQFHAITGTVALVMVVLSSIGLLVGGIGVMNIMLVSVTERTREIGVRKAIGARRSDITWQFLLEATTLTFAGGLIGIIVGWILSFLIRTLVPGLPSTVPLWSVAAGVLVSISVGLFFGLWPAVKAARLDPIVALRYE